MIILCQGLRYARRAAAVTTRRPLAVSGTGPGYANRNPEKRRRALAIRVVGIVATKKCKDQPFRVDRRRGYRNTSGNGSNVVLMALCGRAGRAGGREGGGRERLREQGECRAGRLSGAGVLHRGRGTALVAAEAAGDAGASEARWRSASVDPIPNRYVNGSYPTTSVNRGVLNIV